MLKSGELAGRDTDDLIPLTHLRTMYSDVRQQFEDYCAPLEIEDYGLQAVAETSPAKWHLAHTSWFFETFILKPFMPGYRTQNPAFEYLFNSYYNGIGAQFPRPNRGLLSRPTVNQVYDYRRAIDDAMLRLLESACGGSEAGDLETIATRTEMGLQHEMQHQELFFTDLKYNLAQNPLCPVYVDAPGHQEPPAAVDLAWHCHEGGIFKFGAEDENGFCFDNETPRHRVFLEPFELANRPVTNADVLAFIEDGGYQQPALWLADGWGKVQAEHWQHPLYWRQQDGEWFEFTLHGLKPLAMNGIACHLSAYEADAIARWFNARLPTEFEWEAVAQRQPVKGHFVDSRHYHPQAPISDTLFGSVWQWTSSAYAPYPGYKPAAGAIGEYNGKFMCNQLVLRGGSCVTDPRQVRASYRNFFYPPDRWQFSGVRLAKDKGTQHG